MNSIQHMAADLLNRIQNRTEVSITRKDYEIFCKEYVFDAIKGKSFGSAFCEKFHVLDYSLLHSSTEFAKKHIETSRYINDSHSN